MRKLENSSLGFLLVITLVAGASGLRAAGTKPVFQASFEGSADADTGHPGDLSGAARIVTFPKFAGKGALDLRTDNRPLPSVLYTSVPFNWRCGTIEGRFQTLWSARKGAKASLFFHVRANRKDAPATLSLMLTCDSRYFLCSMSGAERRYFRLEGKWAKSVWHHLALTWEVMDGPKNDVLQIFVDGKLIGALRNLEFDAGHCEPPHPARLRIGENLASNSPYGLRGWVDEFRIYDRVLYRAPPDSKPGITVFVPPGEPQASEAPESYQPEAYLNVAPFTDISSVPYCGTLDYLVDGLVSQGKAAGQAEQGPVLEYVEKESAGQINKMTCFPLKATEGVITFAFPQPCEVTGIRFLPVGVVPAYRVDGDTDGDGVCEKKLIERYGNEVKNRWSFHLFPPVKLHRLRFASIPGHGKGAPALSEFQILAEKQVELSELVREARRQYEPAAGVPVLTFGKPRPIEVPELPREQRLRLGAFTCFWMFDNHTQPTLGKCNPYALQSLREMHMDFIRLTAYLKPTNLGKVTLPDRFYRERIKPPVGAACMLWPSRVCIGYEDNVLQAFLGTMHREGFHVIVEPPRNLPPFDPRSGYYPMAQSDHHGRPDLRFPCVTNGDYYGPAFARILKEITNAGADGVDVCGDEYYIENHNLSRMPRNDPCRRLFKEQCGLDVPKTVEDTERYRKWVLFEYESGGELFARMARAAKEANPKVETSTLLSVAGELFFKRASFGLAYDIVGHRADIDLLGTDPYYRRDTLGHYQIPKYAQLLAGATEKRQTIMTLQAVCNDFRTPFSSPLWVVGAAASVLMNGCKAMDFYRLNYYAGIGPKREHPGTRPIADWCRLVRSLEALGLKEAQPPESIALLYSRASDDWWELKETAGKKAYPACAMAGYLNHAACLRLLSANGHPFRLYYLDQPDTLKNILRFKVLVVPFAYSIGDKAVALIERALDRGARLLIVNGLGETDEFGTKRAEPALKRFLGRQGVRHLDIDLAVHGSEPQTMTAFLKTLARLLENDRPLYLKRYGRDIEAGMLENDRGGKFLFLVNWDEHDTPVDLGLRLPTGQYRVARFALDGRTEARLGEAQLLSAAALRSFRLAIKAHETVVLTVMPAAN